LTKSVHLFPGQGDFPVRDFAAAVTADKALREAAEDVFVLIDRDSGSRGVPELLPWLLAETTPGGRELAAAPVGTEQLALFGASLTVHTDLVRRYGPPAAVLGVSFGEIAALVAAGVLTVRDGAHLAYVLACELSEVQGGLTLLACGESTAVGFLTRSDTGDIAVACVNHAEETVVSGPLEQLELIEERARTAGVRAVRLRLPFSSHHPALTAQADRFADAVRTRPLRSARVPVYSAVAGGVYGPDDDLARGLADCLVRPARLPDVLHRLRADGHDTFFEAGPGSALARATHRVLTPSRQTVLAGLPGSGEPWRPAAPREEAPSHSSSPFPASGATS
jgi:acyl transferase domain-containing protein